MTITCNPGGPPQLAYVIDPNDPKGDPKLCGCNASWVKCNPSLDNPNLVPSAADRGGAERSTSNRLPPCADKTQGLKAVPSNFEYINDGTSACTTTGGTRTCFRSR